MCLAEIARCTILCVSKRREETPSGAETMIGAGQVTGQHRMRLTEKMRIDRERGKAR